MRPCCLKLLSRTKIAWCCAPLASEGQKHEMLNKHTVLVLLKWCGCENRAHQDAQPIHLQTQLSSHAVACASAAPRNFPLLAHAAAMGAMLDKQMVAASVPSSMDKCLVHAALGLHCVHSQHLANLSHPHRLQACAAGCCTVRSPCRCIRRPRARCPLSYRLPAHQAAPASGWCMRRWGRTASMRSPTAGGGASRCAPARACGSTTRRRTAPSTPSLTLAPSMRRRGLPDEDIIKVMSLFWKPFQAERPVSGGAWRRALLRAHAVHPHSPSRHWR